MSFKLFIINIQWLLTVYSLLIAAIILYRPLCGASKNGNAWKHSFSFSFSMLTRVFLGCV